MGQRLKIDGNDLMESLLKPFGKTKSALPIVMIVVVVFLVYLPTLNCGFVWDDDMNLIDNLNFRGLSASHLYWMFTTFHDGNYHPLCWMTFGFDFVIWGLNPTGYHLTNLVLHILNTVLFYYLIVMFLLKTNISSSDSHLSGVQSSAFIGALFFFDSSTASGIRGLDFDPRRCSLCGFLYSCRHCLPEDGAEERR